MSCSEIHVRLITRAHALSREIASLNERIYSLSMSRVREEVVDDKISYFQRVRELLYKELEQHEKKMTATW